MLNLAWLPLTALLMTASASSVTTERMQDVVVKPGDTLWSIAHTWLPDPAKWDEILKHNRLPTSDPTVALPGMILRVPVKLIKISLRAAHLTFYVNMVTRRAHDSAEITLTDPKGNTSFVTRHVLKL